MGLGCLSEYLSKKKTIRNYPKLKLFDAIKVPGFAVITSQFREFFPNTEIIYSVRDPRDFINSAINTWKLRNVQGLSTISWCKENWLKIPEKNPIDRLSIRWKKYLNSAMACDEIIFVRYEDFCNNKVGVIKNLASKVGLPFNETRVRELCDTQLSHASVRNYFPKGDGAWKHGKLKQSHIAQIEKICRNEMIKWKYKLETIK